MKKRLLIILGCVLMVLLLIGGVGYYFLVIREGIPPKVLPWAPKVETLQVHLYFGSLDAMYLIPEMRQILKVDKLTDQAKEVIAELINGSQRNLSPTIPSGTQLRELYIDNQKCAYLDFNKALKANHPGGSAGELLTIYSIVNTMVDNFADIERVQILVEGKEIQTLAGHIDTTKPLIKNPTIVRY